MRCHGEKLLWIRVDDYVDFGLTGCLVLDGLNYIQSSELAQDYFFAREENLYSISSHYMKDWAILHQNHLEHAR